METLELKDIQGIIIRGYSNLPAAEFLLLGMGSPINTKKWLALMASQVTPGDQKNMDTAVNIAFTFEGLHFIGVDQGTLDTFPIELEDGMTTPHKQRFLGDFGNSDPYRWDWGGENNETLHVLLMLYATDTAKLKELHDRQVAQMSEYALYIIKEMGTTVLRERKEHFGFQDGISQPTIKGLARQDDPSNTVSAGEFILGYKNEYDQYTPSPFTASKSEAAKALSASFVESDKKDVGRNGSFMVFRQLKQDVGLFWKYMEKCTFNDKGVRDEKEMIRLAAKMMGRWPGGAPIVICPDEEIKEQNNTNKFEYRKEDDGGLKCPYASHIRRSHPRDALDTSKEASIKIANKHRLLRRGRSFGEPVTENMSPDDILKVEDVQGERGLHFICFNADLGRQFEFIQNAWTNNPKFNGLFDERDPITGNHHSPQNSKMTGTFSIPEKKGVRRRYTDVPEFVTVQGGSYFFMPGITALKYFATF